MRFISVFAIILPLLASWSCLHVSAVPIPNGRVSGSSAQANHRNLVGTHRSLGSEPIHRERATPQGHIMGSMRALKHTMNEQDLHVHINHIQQKIGNSHVVHATHSPGDREVRFHATPRTPGPQGGAMHHLVHNPIGPGSDSHPVHPYERGYINNSLDRLAKTQPRLFHKQQTSPTSTPTHRQGPGAVGTLPVAHESMRKGMTDSQLQAHANWINQHMVGEPYRGAKATVHVTHNPGDAHLTYHATTPALR